MKIRRLELQGFKSFCDRTVFEFGDGITSVVGPNGCGKSNVVDSIKWALGDMSPKSLRGKRMEDVIFAGSAGRKPSGLAEVTLVLDNTDGSLPNERQEVAITRRLYRSGESEYLLNGDAGRLKDIRELFLDTGLGAEGHSIMEQGQIDALLRANSTDRRGIFEEAAGVSRYKQRKKEAESKLEKTAENLERMRDVLDLEEKRLRSLKTQASRARRYRELVDDLRRKKVTVAVLRWRGVTAERAALEQAIDAARLREEAAAADLAALEAETTKRGEEKETARGRVHELESADRAGRGRRPRRRGPRRLHQAHARRPAGPHRDGPARRGGVRGEARGPRAGGRFGRRRGRGRARARRRARGRRHRRRGRPRGARARGRDGPRGPRGRQARRARPPAARLARAQRRDRAPDRDPPGRGPARAARGAARRPEGPARAGRGRGRRARGRRGQDGRGRRQRRQGARRGRGGPRPPR